MSKKTNLTISHISIEDLDLHPRLAEVAMISDTARHFQQNHHGDERRKEWAEELTEDWTALVDSVKEHGVKEALRVIPDQARPGKFLVIDGRHRFRAAQEAGLFILPCREEVEADAWKIIETAAFHRRHLGKSARAYMAVLMHPEIMGASKGRPGKAEVDPIMGKKSAGNATLTEDQLARLSGVSVRLISYAKEILRAFLKSKTLRTKVEPTIWAGADLPAVAAGIAGAAATAGAPRPASSHTSVLRVFRTLTTQLRDFGNWPAEEREAMHTCAAEWARTIPPAAAAVLREALEDAAAVAAA